MKLHAPLSLSFALIAVLAQDARAQDYGIDTTQETSSAPATTSSSTETASESSGGGRLISGNRFGFLSAVDTGVLNLNIAGAGGVNASIMGEFPGIVGVLNLDRGMQVGAGLGFQFDGNGNAATFAGASGEKVSIGLLLHAAYYIKNTEKLAYGPEMQFVAQIVNPFDYVSIQPGFGFWYAPWHAPVYIGGAVGGRLVIRDGPDPVFGLVNPTLRLLWMIN